MGIRAREDTVNFIVWEVDSFLQNDWFLKLVNTKHISFLVYALSKRCGNRAVGSAVIPTVLVYERTREVIL